MSLLSRFQQFDFLNGFQTHNSILDTVPYEPEVIFIGTYNHGWSWNNSDFFYGRGMYMWTVLGNLFLYNRNHLISPRSINNVQPTLHQIFEICEKGKIVFANIVKGIKDDIPVIVNSQEKFVIINDDYKWCSGVINGKKIGEYSDSHIENISKHDWFEDNVDDIVNFINVTTSIKHIYFTFKSGSWLKGKSKIITSNIREGVTYCSIFSPTAKGFGFLLEEPFNKRAWGISHCWIWNGLNHSCPINRTEYGNLDHDWLIDRGVNPNNF